MTIRADRIEIREQSDGSRAAVASGDANRPASYRQKREGLNETVEGSAERIEYDSKTGTLRLIGQGTVRRLRDGLVADEITGAVITWDDSAELFSVQGSAPGASPGAGGRVRAVSDAACVQPGVCTGVRTRNPPLMANVTSPGQAPAAPPSSRLEADGLQKSYGARKVVKDIHLAVGAGEVVGLLGPNGAGKTTTFYMVVGLVRSDAGVIRIDGQPVHTMPIHRRSRLGLSYLPQEASIFRKLTVEENIRAVLELQIDADGRALAKAVIDQRLEQLLKDLSIEKLRASPAPALSGGERRRVEIARALATQPRFILLDEPFAGVDPIAVIEIQRIIGFLRARGIGVLITDHNVRETLGICDRAYIISEGSVLAEGTPTEIVDNAAGAQGLPGRTLPHVIMAPPGLSLRAFATPHGGSLRTGRPGSEVAPPGLSLRAFATPHGGSLRTGRPGSEVAPPRGRIRGARLSGTWQR